MQEREFAALTVDSALPTRNRDEEGMAAHSGHAHLQPNLHYPTTEEFINVDYIAQRE